MKNSKKKFIFLFILLEVLLRNKINKYDLQAEEILHTNTDNKQFIMMEDKEKYIPIESELITIEIKLHDSEYDLEKNFYNKYGNLYLSYLKKNISFVRYGVNYYPIIFAEYFYKENGSYISLGKIDLNGVYNKSGKLICSCPLGIDDGVLGYSSDLLSDPFYLGLCVLKMGEITLLDPYAILEIDFENDSLNAKYFKEIEY